MKKKILILGGDVHQNRGDHAMITGLISWIKDNFPHNEIILYSGNVQKAKTLYHVTCRWTPDSYFGSSKNKCIFILKGFSLAINYIIFRITGKSLIKNNQVLGFYHQLLHTKAIFIHGSGSFNSLWWYDWTYPKTFCALTGYLSRIPTIIVSQGIGPIDNIYDKIVSYLMFKVCRIIGTRDTLSITEVNKISKKSPDKLIFTGDDALLLDKISCPTSISTQLNKNQLNIGINLRDSSGYNKNYNKPNFKFYSSLLDSIIEKYQCTLVFIPISYNDIDDDRESARIIISHMKNKSNTIAVTDEFQPNEIQAIINKMDFSIGTSYHFLLFSLSQNIPSIGFYQDNYYEQKIKGLFNLYSIDEYALNTDSINYKEAIKHISSFINKKGFIVTKLNKSNSDISLKSNNSRFFIKSILK